MTNVIDLDAFRNNQDALKTALHPINGWNIDIHLRALPADFRQTHYFQTVMDDYIRGQYLKFQQLFASQWDERSTLLMLETAERCGLVERVVDLSPEARRYTTIVQEQYDTFVRPNERNQRA